MWRAASFVGAVVFSFLPACQALGGIDTKETVASDAAAETGQNPNDAGDGDGAMACAPAKPTVDEPHFPVGGDADDPANFTVDQAAGTVTDKSTGIVWERAPQNDLTYDAAQCRCHALRLAGASDWRLASRYELASIIDYVKVIVALTGPAFDPTIFPTAPVDYYWSSTLYGSSNPADVNLPVIIALGDGTASGAAQTGAEKSSGWCVRGGNAPASPTRFTTATDTVTDTWTHLVWQRAAPAEAMGLTSDAAATYCTGLNLGGSMGFRIPHVKELETIVAAGRNGPAIDTGLFPGTPPGLYHTSAVYSPQPADTRWFVDFSDGAALPTTTTGRPEGQAVRCVRPLP